MSRWNPKHSKADVIAFFNKHSHMKSTEIAKSLDCSPEYVRATLARAGKRLARSKLKGPSLCGINQKIAEKG